jgi:DNA-binding HxlR family transcriptional regulator
MEAPFLGKAYARELLAILNNGKSTFTGLLDEVKVSRTTLSNTLRALVEDGFVQKEEVGRYAVYRLTEKGLQAMQPSTGMEDSLTHILADYVYRRLRERGLLERHHIDKEELAEEVRRRAQRFLKEVVEGVEKSTKGKG